jgi:7,8-dihydro-6-hydroxymethylpterin dimethyltransferase
MARLEERDYTYFTTVRGMCRQCRQVVPARVFFRDGQVWQEGLCPTCECEPALIAGDQQWYLGNVLRAMSDRAPLAGARPSRLGCPHDCGPCTWHASPCQLPVISITNACNLRCPICFTYNRAEPVYHMPAEELGAILDWIVQSSGPVDLVNITGGEPTLHPDLLDLLRLCRRPEIGRVTMNSNGLRLAEDAALCRALADLGVYVILSLNTLDPDISRRLHGRDLVDVKLRAIENLSRAGAKITLLNVMVRGENEGAAAKLLELLRDNDNILSLTVQTMTYTGQGGGKFPRGRHVPVDEAARIVAAQSDGQIRFDDFITRPSAHPLCYLTCYLVKTAGRLHPLARLVPRGQIENLLKDSYLLHPGENDRLFRDAIDQLYAQRRDAELAVLRELVERLFPVGAPLDDFQRQQAAESAVRTVYIHAHMDEDTFDCSRAMLCPDLVPAGPGRLVPACTYNLFYRRQDERFFAREGRTADDAR